MSTPPRPKDEYRSARHDGAPVAALDQLMATADAVLARRESVEPALAVSAGRPVRGLATLDPSRLQADAMFFDQARTELAGLAVTDLSIEQDRFRRAMIVDLTHRIDGAEFRRLDFVIAPYTGGDLHAEAQLALAAQRLANAADCEVYAALVHDYGRLLREMLEHTARQQAQGLFLAAPALPAARATLQGAIDAMPAAVVPAATRLAALDNGSRTALLETLASLLQSELLPPLQQLSALLGDGCAARAPRGVGLHQYPGGDRCYRHLVRRHADCALEPAEIHRIGLEALDRLRAAKDRLRSDLMPGMAGADFDSFVQTDLRWKAATAAEVEACFIGHMQRLEPMLPDWFGRLPRAPWAVTRADPAFEPGMSFGYFQRASPSDPVGRYRYNGSAPGARSLIGAAHLIYHELLPGHHLQLSLQDQASIVHPLQTNLFSTATIEGWAVYSSELACEMGAITGFDLYGHAQMQSFMAARLVVDTGLNALGWTLEQARAFMHANTVESPGVIDSELLRYSTDIPAQALAYELGHIGIEQLRQGAQRQLGAAFNVRGFHDALLANGGYPLTVLADQIDHWVAAQSGAVP